MVASVSRRSLSKAAVEHAVLPSLVNDADEDKGGARKQLLLIASGHSIQCGRTLPSGDQDFIASLLSDEEYPFASSFTQAQMAMAVALIRTAGSDAV